MLSSAAILVDAKDFTDPLLSALEVALPVVIGLVVSVWAVWWVAMWIMGKLSIRRMRKEYE